MNPIRSQNPKFSFDVNIHADSVFVEAGEPSNSLSLAFALSILPQLPRVLLPPEWKFFRGREEILEPVLQYKSFRSTRSDHSPCRYPFHLIPTPGWPGWAFWGVGGGGGKGILKIYSVVQTHPKYEIRCSPPSTFLSTSLPRPGWTFWGRAIRKFERS